MNDFMLFLGKFLTQGTAIASVAPSSRWLSRTTVRNVDWERARVLVELGAIVPARGLFVTEPDISAPDAAIAKWAETAVPLIRRALEPLPPT